MLSITKVFEFEAAHKLPRYKGNCAKLHGHTYKLEVEITDYHFTYANRPISGMIVDFKRLSTLVKQDILSFLDHTYLNTYIKNPTAENIVLWIVDRLKTEFSSSHNYVSRVRLWETSTSYAEWKEKPIKVGKSDSGWAPLPIPNGTNKGQCPYGFVFGENFNEKVACEGCENHTECANAWNDLSGFGDEEEEG